MASQTKRRMTSRQAMIIVLPYLLLWLLLGSTIDSAVFRFWEVGQNISGVGAMRLTFVPIFFSVLYLPSVLLHYAQTGKVGWFMTGLYASIALVVSFIFCPIP